MTKLMVHARMGLLSGASFLGPIVMDALAALEERKLKHIEDAQKIFDKADEEGRDLTEEEVAQTEKLADDAEKVGKQIEARKRLSPTGQGRRSQAEPQNGQRQVPAAPRTDLRNGGFRHLGEFAATVHNAAKRDEAAFTRLQNVNQNEGAGEDGGFLVPAEFRESIMKIVEGETSLLSRTDGSTTARNAVHHPKDETTPWGTEGVQVYWDGEGQQGTPSKGKFQGDSLRLNKLFALVDATDEILEDAPQLDNYLRVKVPEVMTSVLNRAIISGNGVGKPLGFMNSPALVTVSKETSQPADTVHHRNIVKMWSRMYAPCRANAIWLINQDVEPQLDLMSFRDGTSTPVPVYLPAGTIAGQGYATLKGRPVIPVQGMETLGDLGDIALVDLTKYRTLTKSGGARVDTSIHLKFDLDTTTFRFIFRVAGAPWWSAPISPENGLNTLSPFITLESR